MMLISSGIFEGRSTVGRKRAKYRGNPIKRTKIRFWNSGKIGKRKKETLSKKVGER